MTEGGFKNFTELDRFGYSEKADIWKVRFLDRPEGIELGILKKFSRAHKSHQQEGEISQQICKLHPSFVVCYLHYPLGREYHILYEFCGKGNLKTEISRRRKIRQHWTESELITICGDLFEAMRLMHAERLIHGDIKPDNLFITEAGQIKIGDFGTGKRKMMKTLQTTSVMGTASYLPPEFLKAYMVIIEPHLRLDLTKVDVWCFGRVLAEMACLKFFRRLKVDNQEQLDSDLNRVFDKTQSTCLRNLIMKMHRVEPRERPSFAELHSELEEMKRLLLGPQAQSEYQIDSELTQTEVCQPEGRWYEETKEVTPLDNPPEVIRLECRHTIQLDKVTSHLLHKFIDDLKCLTCSRKIPYTYLKSLSYSAIEDSLTHNLQIKHTSKCPNCAKSHETTRLNKWYLALPIECDCHTSFCSLCLKKPAHRLICSKSKKLE
jgi:serine/threonine protein kinase